MQYRLSCLSTFFLFLTFNVCGQDWEHFLFSGTLNLSNTIVTSITTDNYENKWIGTNKGIYMFNDNTKLWHHFKGFTTSQQQTFIYKIHKSSSGTIYACSEYGLAKYNPSGNNWTLYTTSDGLSSNIIRDVVSFGSVSTKLWIATHGGGACYFNGSNFEVYNTTHGLPSNTLYAVHMGFVNDVWFGSSAGIAHFEGSLWTTYTTADGLPSNTVISAARGINNTMWFGTTNGACSFDGNNWQAYTTADGLAGNIVYSVFTESTGVVWFTTNNGVSKYDGAQWETLSTSDGLTSDTVYCMTKTLSDYWFGHENVGISILSNNSWSTLLHQQSPVNSQVTSITQDNNGRIWFGSNNGISVFDGNNWTILNTQNSNLPSNWIYTLITDKTGNIWIGTSHGLVRYIDGFGFTVYSVNNGLPSNYVLSLFCDDSNRIWAGTWNGLAIVQQGIITSYTYDDGLAANSIRSFAQDNENNIWISHYSNFFTKYDGTYFTLHHVPVNNENFSNSNYLYSDANKNLWAYSNTGVFKKANGRNWDYITNFSSTINTMVHASDNSFWFGLYQKIMIYRNGNIISISNPGGIQTANFRFMFSDQQGNIWVSHSKGVSRVNPALITNSPSQEVFKTHVQIYPNPFEDNFYIKLETSRPTDVEVVLVCVSGKEVLSENHSQLQSGNHTLKIGAANLAAGIYFVLIIRDGELSKTIKLVKT